MNAKLRIAVVLLPILGLAACTTMDERSTYIPSERSQSIMDNDATYVAAVERIARDRGIEVVWVNPPRKPRTVASNDN